MNMQTQQTIPDVQSESNSLKKHAPERPPMFEELDKLNASFKHGMYEFNVKDIVDVSDNAKNNYNAIASKMSLLNTNLIRSIKEIKVYNSGGKNPGKKTGKIDRKNLYKYKTSKDIFFDNTYKIKECDLAFGIILDESGSMRGEGVRNGVATLIVLHETLKALNINHSIISHNSSNYHQCHIKRFQTFKEDKPFQCDKNYAITNITGGRCNCDSGALYYMEQAFRRVKNKDKICLMFSDGEPTECSDTDLKEQIQHMEKAGIKVIGIGIDFPNIKEYYREYANGSSLKDMFDIVSNILKQYVLEKVDKE
jgi:nitric oxide reductase activation protein